MELLGWGPLDLSPLHVAAWRQDWPGWLSALSMAAIALAGGLFVFGVAAMGSIGIVAGIIAGDDVSGATRQQQVMMIGAAVGAIVGIPPLARRITMLVRAKVNAKNIKGPHVVG